MTIFGDGTQQRAFSYIGDVAPVIARSIDVPEAYNTVFNVGADVPYSVNQLAEVVAKCVGVELKVNHLDPRDEVLHAFSSHQKAKRVFGCEARVDLEEGISRMAQWAKKVGVRRSKPFQNIEILKNLPKIWLQDLKSA